MKDWSEAFKNAGYKKVGFKYSKTNHLLVKARINGISGDFILDTGASATCVSKDEVEHFNLHSELSETKASGAGAVDMETALSENNELKLGHWKIKSLSLIILDLSHVNQALTMQNVKPVHGIIGADVLLEGQAVIDYGQKKLYLR
ncbi:retropepsin-like aspartic protease [Avrilella dinanensis]|uniref:Acid protease n=1 Tax=Avrilella dinanensis TaxID=2008672 RepID=A0A2M9R3B2_9FLAO|nr:retropepsin-like aspartic protease [Avrilella dinanensis]PJR03354.1 acid protease [Avrilella dinanensis]